MRYNISATDAAHWKGDAAKLPVRGDRVYVLVSDTGNGIYSLHGVFPARPHSSANQAVLPARVQSDYNGRIALTYGIERYYIPEGSGRMWANGKSSLLVQVKIAPWGQIKMEQVRKP